MPIGWVFEHRPSFLHVIADVGDGFLGLLGKCIFLLAFSCDMQYTCLVRYGDVAQLGERSVRIREVEGSIPFVSTISTSEESALPIPFSIEDMRSCFAGAYRLLVHQTKR